MADTRETISRALTVCRKLGDAINSFLPRWADHVGFKIKIEGIAVAIDPEVVFTSGILVPPTIVVPGQPPAYALHGRGTKSYRPHDQRPYPLHGLGPADPAGLAADVGTN